MSRSRVAIAAALAGCLSGCLPGDLRPEPGSVLVEVAPAPSSTDGFTTDDGWTVTLERLVTGVGAVQLGGEGCNGYSEPRYTRLFDFAQPMAPAKVALVYGLGDCDLGYELSAPDPDALLGPGVSGEDLAFMRVEAGDDFIPEPERVSVYAVGSAVRGAATKRFAWVFRQEYDIEECLPGSAVHLGAAAEEQRLIAIDAAELFRIRGPEGELELDPFAAADADGDGDITLTELDAVAPLAGDDPAVRSLATHLYEALVPRLARPSGSLLCKVELDD